MRHWHAVILASGLFCGAAAGAQQDPGSGHPGTPGVADTTTSAGRPGQARHRGLFRGIRWTADQKRRLRAVRAKYRPQREALRARRQKERAAGTATSDTALFRQARELGQQERDEIRRLLAADQQKTFDANLARIGERSNEHQGEHPRGEGAR